MTASSAVSHTSPWPADAGYFSPSTRPKPLYLVRLTRVHAACAQPGCGESIFSDGGQWRHASNNMQYRCPSGAGWAQACAPEDVEALLAKQADELENEAQDSAEQARTDGYDEGYDVGRKEGHAEAIKQGRQNMHAEIDEAFNAVINGGRSFANAAQLREALAAAWDQITP
jgi:hypothetical protein